MSDAGSTIAHFDVIVIGSGPGGASLSHRLAKTGKRILILERGDFLPRSEDNWSPQKVFVEGIYQADERWIDVDGNSFAPALHYFVGGNSKVYGGALFRMRERDFGEVIHAGGSSPAWPLDYSAFEPHYQAAEELFEVHGARGEDPLEPWASAPYPHPPVSHEPAIAKLSDALSGMGLRPFHIPLGIKLEEVDGKPASTSPCIRCSYFDGFPCPFNAKADAQIICIDPMLAANNNLTLLTGAYVSALRTDLTGKNIAAVEVIREGLSESYSADVVVVAAGALSSALLLLRSANAAHPNGLANGSDQLGRNYLRHEMSVLMAVMRRPVDTVFQKTMAISDFYYGSDDWDYPLGLIQLMATSHMEQIKAEVLPQWLEWLPGMPFDQIARHSLDFWLQSEDLPDPANRIYYRDGQVHLDLKPTNPEALVRLKAKLKQVLDRSGHTALLIDRSLYLGKDINLTGTAHQAGTARFGTDPKSSVLDTNCKAHEIDNLYLADASFFPSISAVNPTLTIIANALRVADVIAERLA
jgi:choline dehydrogenase-like flavoprotein